MRDEGTVIIPAEIFPHSLCDHYVFPHYRRDIVKGSEGEAQQKGSVYQCDRVFQYGFYRVSYCNGDPGRGSSSYGYELLYWKYGAVLDGRGLVLTAGSRSEHEDLHSRKCKKDDLPPIKGFTVGIILVLLDVELPAWIYNPIAQIGDTATPVAMLVIGSILRNINYKEIKMSADIAVLLLNRFIISPLIMLAVMMVLPLVNMAKQVYLILIIMPAMTQFGILAKETGADYEFCTVMIAVTTVASMIVIPFYTAILGMVF